jgi:hypothetical protein
MITEKIQGLRCNPVKVHLRDSLTARIQLEKHRDLVVRSGNMAGAEKESRRGIFL